MDCNRQRLEAAATLAPGPLTGPPRPNPRTAGSTKDSLRAVSNPATHPPLPPVVNRPLPEPSPRRKQPAPAPTTWAPPSAVAPGSPSPPPLPRASAVTVDIDDVLVDTADRDVEPTYRSEHPLAHAHTSWGKRLAAFTTCSLSLAALTALAVALLLPDSRTPSNPTPRQAATEPRSAMTLPIESATPRSQDALANPVKAGAKAETHAAKRPNARASKTDQRPRTRQPAAPRPAKKMLPTKKPSKKTARPVRPSKASTTP